MFRLRFLQSAYSMSASKLKDIKYIPKSTKYLVLGYNKHIEQILGSNIPILINSLCILYYFESDYFEIAGSGITISEDKKSITKTKSTYARAYDNTTYLCMIIPSTQCIECIWTLKIQSSTGTIYSMINIGITSNNEIDKNFTAWRHDDNYSSYSHYAYNGYAGYKSSNNGISSYGKSFGSGDTIDVHLDLSKKQLIFYKNGISQGVAYNNIATNNDIKYKLAVSIHALNHSVTLTKFKKK
eukprot:297059_1